MAQKNNNYQNNFDYDGTSLSGLRGFVSFQSEKDKEFYFRFNDENGQPVLYSEGYGKIAGRDNGIASVLKNARLRKRYKIVEEGGKWVVSLRAANNHEIARTKAFANKEEAQKTVKWLIDNLVPKATPKPDNVIKKTVAQVVDNPAPKKAFVAGNDPKYTFRIQLYPLQDGPLAGVITNVLNEENKKFRGVDAGAIADFILAALSDKDTQMSLPAPAPSKTQPDKKRQKHSKPAPSLPPQENLIVELAGSSEATPSSSWTTEEYLNVRLILKEGTTGLSGQKVKMNVHLYQLQNPAIAMELITEVEFTNGKSAGIELQKLKKAGLYRLTAVSEGKATGQPLFGTTALQVYDCPAC
ncbi:MAG TPA: DUF1508 domain-containing protein [Bacteroidetes bacterium]|nr:DUF1508 domain-containing protein [Bacteroidota bacterium]